MEAIGRLAGGVAHDFNNLMQIVVGWSDRMLKIQDPKRLESGLRIVNEAGQKAASLTRQLLAFGRQQVVQPEALDLGRTTEAMLPMLSRLLSEEIRIDWGRPEKPVWVMADPTQVEQVLMNLAVNARDAMPRGGRLAVAVSDAPAEEPAARNGTQPWARLTVSDTGCGMDAETAEHIFEPFFSTKPVNEGTGLGLATIYGIVKQSGGEIEVDTAPDEGTTFRIYLPLLEPHLPQEGTDDRQRPASCDLQGAVLVVEDEQMVRSLMAEELEACGLDVLRAGGYDEAVALARGHDSPVDVLITDMVLEGKDGSAVADAVVRIHPHACVLYISGYSETHVAQRNEGPPGDFLQKPFHVDKLVSLVRGMLAPDV
jgi:CheY-like chemotaxis protein